MKRFLLALLVLCPMLGLAQSKYQTTIMSSGYVPFPTVRVCTEPASGTPCTPLASVYSDPGLSQPLPNPFTGDALGNVIFYAACGTTYHAQISGLGIQPYDIANIGLPGCGGGGGGTGTVTSVSAASGGGIVITGNPAISPSVGLITTCSASQILVWSGSAWGCGANGTGTVTSVVATSGGGLVVTGTPSVIPSIGLITSCGTGQVLAWNGSVWACANSGSIGGSGTTNKLALWTNSSTLGNASITDTSGGSGGGILQMIERVGLVGSNALGNQLSGIVGMTNACSGNSSAFFNTGTVGCWDTSIALNAPSTTSTGNMEAIVGYMADNSLSNSPGSYAMAGLFGEGNIVAQSAPNFVAGVAGFAYDQGTGSSGPNYLAGLSGIAYTSTSQLPAKVIGVYAQVGNQNSSLAEPFGAGLFIDTPVTTSAFTVLYGIYQNGTEGNLLHGSLTLAGLAGGGIQCLEVNNAGLIVTTGSACGTGGGGGGITGATANQALNATGATTGTSGFSDTTGTVTVGDIAAYTASGTIGNCQTLPCLNALGVFNSSSTWIASGEVSVNLDGTVSVTAGGIVCNSSSGPTGHYNGAVDCPTGQRVGYVKTTASNVTAATVDIVRN